MVDTNTWPDLSTYMTLVAPKVTAAVREMDEDNETDSYIAPPIEIPFTVHQLYANLFTTGPLITEFPVPIQALMDIGSPCTVISAELCDCLSLRRYPLPTKENNLTSLSQLPLVCEGYIKLELQSTQGVWKSWVHKMKVNKGLPLSIILGMPFLSSEQILIDSSEQTAIDKHSGYDLMNPPLLTAWARVVT